MKSRMSLICAVVTGVSFCGCQPKKTAGEKDQGAIALQQPKQFVKPVNKFAGITMASKKDTSCGMPLSAGLEDTVQLNNKVYGFCSKECKEAFVKTLQTQHKR